MVCCLRCWSRNTEVFRSTKIDVGTRPMTRVDVGWRISYAVESAAQKCRRRIQLFCLWNEISEYGWIKKGVCGGLPQTAAGDGGTCALTQKYTDFKCVEPQVCEGGDRESSLNFGTAGIRSAAGGEDSAS